MSRAAKWIWKLETPASVPAGARISAGKFGQRREVVAERRGRVGEAPAGELHAVAGVAGEADDNPVLIDSPRRRHASHDSPEVDICQEKT